MGVEKILKQLTPERIEKEIAAIKAVKLPPEIQKWVDEYKKVGDRDDFLWQWLYKMFQGFFLPIVLEKYQKSLVGDKILMTMFIAQIDDIADKSRQEKLLNELLRIPWGWQQQIKANAFSLQQENYLLFAGAFLTIGFLSCQGQGTCTGDYCSGTNHVLPTEGNVRFTGGLSVRDFLKVQTYQSISQKGAQKLAPAALELASAEGLTAHKESIKIRLKFGK